MNFAEMLKALADGKKVRPASWDFGEYVFLDKQSGYIIGSRGNEYTNLNLRGFYVHSLFYIVKEK